MGLRRTAHSMRLANTSYVSLSGAEDQSLVTVLREHANGERSIRRLLPSMAFGTRLRLLFCGFLLHRFRAEAHRPVNDLHRNSADTTHVHGGSRLDGTVAITPSSQVHQPI